MNLSELYAASTRKTQLRDDFEGVELSTEWSVVYGAGMSVSVGGSNLTIGAGTVANAESSVTSLRAFRLPLRLQVLLRLTQRIANQDFYIELVDATDSLYARWRFNGTSATTALAETSSGTPNTGSSLGVGTSLVGFVAEIALDRDRILFSERPIDSGSGATLRRAVNNRIPSEDTDLFVRIRAKNGAVAPASGTSLIVDYVLAYEHERLDVSVQSGHGISSGSAALATPVTVMNTFTVDTELATAAALADGAANPTTAMVGAGNMLFNGTTWDRQRGNYNGGTGDSGAKASGVFTGTTQINYNGRGAMIQLDIAAASALNVKVQAQLDGGSGFWYDIPGASFPVINAAGVYILTIYPGLTAVANSVVPFVLPRNIRLHYSSSGFTLNNAWFAYIL